MKCEDHPRAPFVPDLMASGEDVPRVCAACLRGLPTDPEVIDERRETEERWRRQEADLPPTKRGAARERRLYENRRRDIPETEHKETETQ